MDFKRGDKVVQVIQAPVEGTVGGFSLDQETGDVLVRVDWTDEAGDNHQRFFKKAELTVVAPK